MDLLGSEFARSAEIPAPRELYGISVGVAAGCIICGFYYQFLACEVREFFSSIPVDFRPLVLVLVAASSLLAIVANPHLFDQAGSLYYETGLVVTKLPFFFGAVAAGRLAARNFPAFVAAAALGVGAAYGLDEVNLAVAVSAVVVVIGAIEVTRYVVYTVGELNALLVLGNFLLAVVGGAFKPEAVARDDWHEAFGLLTAHQFPLGFAIGFSESCPIGDHVRGRW